MNYTEPVVLASISSGRGLWVIDQVRWDRPEGHEVEARRYLSTLLTSLGGSAVVPPIPAPAAAGAGE